MSEELSVRFRDVEILADLPRGEVIDLPVSRNC